MNQNVHTSEIIKELVNKVDSMDTLNKMLKIHISQIAQ